jgi:hypothetical protein
MYIIFDEWGGDVTKWHSRLPDVYSDKNILTFREPFFFRNNMNQLKKTRSELNAQM